jgi:YD repeat-containing protein
LNWNGSVYSTTANSYNARDQITLVRQYQGADTSGVYQDTTMTYDGYGRLQSKHVPEQNAGTATVYSYNSDDTINSVTDARGASATYTYNNRHLVTGINYSAPAGITPTSNVSFGYDAAGNRTSMTDGFGSTTYSYNQLSQLLSEERTFNGVGSYTLSYDYNLAGQLKKITDPTNMTINYGFDSTGQLSGVTGSDSLYAGVSTYASNFQYRAWGAAKHLNYGNSLTLDLGYNSRLQTTQYDLKTAGGAEVFGLQYQYTSSPASTDNDGRLKYSHDLVNSNLDRTYSYDQAARITLGDTANGSFNGPYKQTYGYDAWGNLTNRSWRTFYYNQYCNCMAPTTNYSSSTYTNNRNTATGWNYDADGRLLGSADGGANFTYAFDAAGQLISNTAPGKTLSQSLDGDGVRAKWVENGVTTYYVRSSALGGQTIVELDQYGNKVWGYVYGGGQEIAKQEGGQVLWDQRDASGVSMRLTNGSGGVASKIETDPLGTQVDDTSVFNQNGGGNGYAFNPNGFYGDPAQPDMGCTEGGVPTPCNLVQASLRAGGSYQCSGWICPTVGWDPGRDGPGRGGFFLYRYTDEGILRDPIGGSQNSGKRAPLSETQAELFKHESKFLLWLLDHPASDCAKFLKKTFGFNASRVARAVRGIRAYDGTSSTLTMGAAGLLPYHDRTGIPVANARMPVNEYFELKAVIGQAVTAMQAGHSMRTQRDIYFGDYFTAQTILHEALHMFGGLNDDKLASRLGVTIEEGDTSVISEALKKGGCGH